MKTENNLPDKKLRVLIVSINATDEFGGESILPLHYFRFLRLKGIDVFLVTHERVKQRLTELLGPEIDRVFFIPETATLRLLNDVGKHFNERVRAITTDFLMQLITQISQWRLVRKVIKEKAINVVHEPAPVSPKRPSALFLLGAPVIIGPMNGGMNFPDGFSHMRTTTERYLYLPLRVLSHVINLFIPGKLFAKKLLVANQRTKKALPLFRFGEVVELVENGVDLTLWQDDIQSSPKSETSEVNFVFVGRLVDWKCVDLLIKAFKQINKQDNFRLLIVGDGEQKSRLVELAGELVDKDIIQFLGWLPQEQVKKVLMKSDVLVLPSVRECGGAVVLEAMSMKKPVIAVDWGGPADYIDNESGILIEPTNENELIQGLAKAMNKLGRDGGLRKRLGNNAYSRIIESYNWHKKIDQILNIYRSIV